LREGIEGNLRSLRVDQPAAVNFRLPGHGHADARFDDQMGAMVAARDEGSSLV
jgi:pyridoxine 4-dehydrogenase